MTHAASTAERIEIKISSEDFRVRKGDEVDLRKWPTNVGAVFKFKEQYQKLLVEYLGNLSSLKQLLYASNRFGVLLIFQAMDAAGKDGAIKHVMSWVNPQGCQVFSFKHPSPTELQYDFLWRPHSSRDAQSADGNCSRSASGAQSEILSALAQTRSQASRGQ